MLAPAEDQDLIVEAHPVRFAAPEDKDEVFELSLSVHKENGIFRFSVNKFNMIWNKYISRSGVIIGVIGPSGGIQGGTILNLGSMYYTDDLVLEELYIHVLPQYRKSKNAIKLIEFAKEASRRTGAPLMIGIVSNKRTEAKVRLYRRRLGEPAGAFFLYKGDK